MITGADKGLGHATARRLLAAGHTVHLGARDVEQGAEAIALTALLGPDGPTGGSIDLAGPIPW
ncbi:hypothetical protein A6A07_35340 [Streptomyces sp. CB03911]|nr:hypothetical protein A6A07_35340 [Streptomyces sp. CB03911]